MRLAENDRTIARYRSRRFIRVCATDDPCPCGKTTRTSVSTACRPTSLRASSRRSSRGSDHKGEQQLKREPRVVGKRSGSCAPKWCTATAQQLREVSLVLAPAPTDGWVNRGAHVYRSQRDGNDERGVCGTNAPVAGECCHRCKNDRRCPSSPLAWAHGSTRRRDSTA